MNPQGWAIPQVHIAQPPNTTALEANTYRTELGNLRLALLNTAQFLGLAQNVNLPTMPVTALNVNALQNTMDMQIQTLDMYCAMLLNAQNLILFLMNQPAPAAAAWPTVKINKPEFDGTPREKA
jgi:hypothetical protein